MLIDVLSMCRTAACHLILFLARLTRSAIGSEAKATTDVDVDALNVWRSESEWKCNTPPVQKRYSMAPYVSSDGDHFLLHGGSIGQGVNVDETWVYSVEANVWSNVTDENIKPTSRRSHTTVTLCNSAIILFGGKGKEEKMLNETWVFEIDNMKWRRPDIDNVSDPVPPMFTHAAVVVSSRNRTSCQCKQSILVIPGPSDGVLDWSTVWELVCVEDRKAYRWSRVKTKWEASVPRGHPGLATGTTYSEIAVVALSNNGLWTYQLTKQTWKQVYVHDRPPFSKSAIALFFPFLQSYVVIMDRFYFRYNIASGKVSKEVGIGQNSVTFRGGAAAVFGSYAIVYRGAIRACRQLMINLTRECDRWLAYKLPDSLLTPIFGYQLVLGVWKNNFYVIGSPNDENRRSSDPKGTLWKLNLETRQWFQLHKRVSRHSGQITKDNTTNSVFLHNCACFLCYRYRFPNKLNAYYPNADRWKVFEINEAPPIRRGHSFVAINSSAILLFSGFKTFYPLKPPEPRDDLWILSFIEEVPQWYPIYSSTRTTNVYPRVRPTPRAMHAAAVIDHHLFMYGGVDGNFSVLTDMWSFNTTAHRWTRIEQITRTPMFLNQHWKMSAVTYGHHMLVTVGCTNVWNRDEDYCGGVEQQSTWMYDPYINRWILLSTTKSLSNLFVALNDYNYQNNLHLYKGRLLILENRVVTKLYFDVLACPLGLASPNMYSTNCDTCPLGTYAERNRKECVRCPLGLTTKSIGSFDVNNCSRCVDDYCRHGDCILTVIAGKPTPGCRCHFGFTGTRCHIPTYIILFLMLILVGTLICLFAVFCINKWRYKKIREGQLQRHVEELTSVWQIRHKELQLLDRIGEGGFGKVHKAVYRETEVAVKLLKDVEPDHQLIKEFEREILFMQTVRHPNIVMFIGAGLMDDGSRFFVTEFMHRGSLRDVLETNKANGISFITQIEFAIDAAKGMEFLHSLTPVRIHRDLKSPNFLVSKAWTVRVSDFGLGRQILSEKAHRKRNKSIATPLLEDYVGSTCTTRVGTVAWRAPELSTSKRYGTSVDVYRLTL